MKMGKFDSQSGMSLIEILIVLVVTAILATFAIAQLGQSKTNLQRQNVARELKVSLERARFDSVKRRASDNSKRASVKVNATTFDVTTDLNTNGTIEATDTRQINFGSSDIRIVSSNLTFPITVKFDHRGQITATDNSGANVTPRFIICNNCTALTATPENANFISISPTGTIVMTAFGASEPTFQNPVVGSIPIGTEIKNTVAFGTNYVAPGGGTPTPTPTPAATPTPNPTPTPPNATPTPTPTPPPTPTPAPPPTACIRNQRPAQDNCVCKSPMFVRSNGKCQ